MRGPAEDRFWAKVNKSGGCWNWTASTGNHGYGQINVGGTMVLAHRFAYQLLVGPIQEGKEIDHRCRNRRCVNPRHLRLVSRKQNMENASSTNRNNSSSGIRGVSWSARANQWIAYVRHNYRQIHVGYFDNLAEAQAAVAAKRRELFTHNDADRSA